MLSVQTAGCAGMERLGVPTRTSLNTPPDDRGQFICRMRVDAIQARELLAVRGDTVILNTGNNSQTNNNTNHHQQQLQQHNHHKQQHSHQNQNHLQQNNTHQPQHYQRMTTPNNTSVSGNCAKRSNSKSNNASSNIVRGDIECTTLKYVNTGSGNKANSFSTGSTSDSYANAINGHNNDHHQNYKNHLQQQQQALRCPYHVPLPDSEWGQDRNLQIRTAYQQSEITRSYITPAPNKTIKDVPEQSNYNFAAITQQHFNCPSPTPSPQHLQTQLHPPTHQNKSKSVIIKLFSRKSSPKSPTALSGSSTNSSLTSSASMSSSASSLASGMSASLSASSLAATPLATLPIATATTLKTTPCNYGATTAPHTSATLSAHLTTSTAQQMISIGIAAPTTAAIDRIPTPPLAVLVPIACQTQTQQNHQKIQEQQFDNVVAEHANAASCIYSTNSSILMDMTLAPAVNVVTTTLPQGMTEAAPLSSTSAITPMHVTTNMSRNNSNSSMLSCSCNCNSKNCDICNTAKS